MNQPPAHLGLVAVTANVVKASDSPVSPIFPNGNVQLLLIMKTDTGDKISTASFSKLVETELSLLEADQNCLVTAKDLLQPGSLEKPIATFAK